MGTPGLMANLTLDYIRFLCLIRLNTLIWIKLGCFMRSDPYIPWPKNASSSASGKAAFAEQVILQRY